MVVGLKPDFSGSVIPHVVTGNFIHGLKSIEDYYISAKGARLAFENKARYKEIYTIIDSLICWNPLELISRQTL